MPDSTTSGSPLAQTAESDRRFADRDVFVCVAIGGMIGALLRHLLGVLIPTARDGWPTATFVVNLTGAFVLGVVLVAARELAPDPLTSAFARRFRPFLVTGVLGGYTTFSTYMVETHGLIDTGAWGPALAYLFGSLAAGVVLVWLGMAMADVGFGRFRPRETPTVAVDVAAEQRETEDEA